MLIALLAVNWEFELRGILTVMIGVGVLMGSIYLILGTNVGARLGFMITFTALAGWMMLMGGIWWVYGIGLKGDDASWQQVPGQTVIQQVELLYEAGVVDVRLPVTSEDPPDEASDAVAAQLASQGWVQVDESAPEFGQAEASATVFLEEEGAFAPGEFDVTAVFEIDPPDESAFPKLFGRDELDQIAFFHKPYYTLVEVAPYEPLLTEPGRAPTTPEVDDSRPRQYVLMVRDLGSLREPAAYITLGSGIVFFTMVYFLNRRDRIVAVNLERKAVAAA